MKINDIAIIMIAICMFLTACIIGEFTKQLKFQATTEQNHISLVIKNESEMVESIKESRHREDLLLQQVKLLEYQVDILSTKDLK